MTANPLVQLGALGQSPWLDYITRDLLQTGELRRLIADDGLRGMTTNPTIFEKAIAGSDRYDADIRALADSRLEPGDIVETLAVADVRAACDMFLPLYDASDAHLAGLERRRARREPISRVASVASFFVSRVDTKLDPLLEQSGDAAARGLRGTIAIANAIVAYEAFQQTFRGPRWDALTRDGARVQRPLWASTSTKDPAFPDIYYVEALVAPDTVNTLPPETLKAYGDHGRPEVRITEQTTSEAKQRLTTLAGAGFNLEDVTRALETEGVQKFSASFTALLNGVGQKAMALSGAS